jgi:hypothetical protein
LRRFSTAERSGVPLLYRMPYFLMHMDTMYDDVARLHGDGGLRAVKRAIGAPVSIISADWEVNKYGEMIAHAKSAWS